MFSNTILLNLGGKYSTFFPILEQIGSAPSGLKYLALNAEGVMLFFVFFEQIAKWQIRTLFSLRYLVFKYYFCGTKPIFGMIFVFEMGNFFIFAQKTHYFFA